MKNIAKYAIILIVISIIFGFGETLYFLDVYGWHVSAINTSETICDMISYILLGLGIIFLVNYDKIRSKTNIKR